MRGLVRRSRIGRWSVVAVLPALLAAAPAQAADGGFFGFLSSLGGGGAAPAPAEAPPSAEPERPLTVRPFRKKRAARASLAHANVPGKTGPVSIYEDPTLRTGDAVMTKNGMRVFSGARYSPDRPYGDDDFVAVSASKAVTPGLKKTLIELNKLPPHG